MRRSLSVLLACIAFGLGTASVSFDAHAQESGGNDKAAADVLFEQGRTLLNTGKFAEACPKLAESNRLDPGIGTMLFLAECWQRAGKTASAWAQFREAEALAAKTGDTKRERVAHDHAETLAPTLATLTVRVGAGSPSNIVVVRDGRDLGSAMWGTSTPIDPGAHTLRATADGYDAWEKKIDIKTSEHVAIDVPLLVKRITPPTTDGHVDKPVEPSPPRRTWQKPLALGVAVVGAAAVGVGVGFGLSAIAKNDRANTHCNGLDCDAEGIQLGDKAMEHGNIATIGVIAGAVFIIGGAVLYFTAPSSSSASSTAAHRALFTF